MDEKNRIIKALRQKDGSFIISLPPNGNFLVNGIPFATDYNSSKTITCDSIPKVQLIENLKEVVSYRNIATEETISIDQYLDQIKALIKFMSVNDEGHRYWKPENIDQEFEYKKFVNKYMPVYKEFTNVLADFQINIQNKIYSDNPYIVPISHVGGDIAENIFVYDSKIAQMSMVHEIAKKYGYTFYENVPSSIKKEGTYSNSTHSGLRFLQISGHYVMNDDWERKARTIQASYEECLAAYKIDYDNLNKIFLLDKEKNSKIDQITLKEIHSKMKSILHLANKVDFKVVSRTEYRLLIKNINECIERVESNLLEKA